MKIVLIVVFILTACGLFLLLSGLFVPTPSANGRVLTVVGHLKAADTADRQGDDAVREERKETAENTGCVLHGRSGILRKIHRDECLQKKQDAECPKCGRT